MGGEKHKTIGMLINEPKEQGCEATAKEFIAATRTNPSSSAKMSWTPLPAA